MRKEIQLYEYQKDMLRQIEDAFDASICDGTNAYWNRKDRSDFGSSEERRTKSEESMCVDCCTSA